MMDKPGVFIRSQEKNVNIIIEGCQSLMKKVEGNNCSITGMKPDSKYGGYRIYFNDYSIVASFLKQKYLPLVEHRASIHSLKTVLALHDIVPECESSFKDILRAQLEKKNLKPLLGICSKPISLQFPDISSCGDWMIELDIPEIEDLEVFKNAGLPHSMSVTFPSENEFRSAQVLKVSHLCCLCLNDSHSREQCPELENFFILSRKESDDVPFSSNSSLGHSRFEIRERVPESITTPSSSKSAKQNRIEAIASGLKKQRESFVQKSESDVKLEIKREYEEEESFVPVQSPMAKLQSPWHSSSKKKRLMTTYQSDEDIKNDDIPAATSTTGRESPIEIVYEKPAAVVPSLSRISGDSTNYFDQERFNEDHSISFSNLPTSSKPETSCERVKPDATLRDNSDFSDSNDSVKSPNYKRKKPTYVPVVLPPRIKQIVLSRERKEGELDVGQLEAFFNHVKKKMSPAKIAKQFTSDVPSLKEQLKSIVQQYYMTPKAGSGEDSRFMKWLEGMLDRFDSVPSKRKKLKSEPDF